MTNTTENANWKSLPFFKHFSENEINTKNFRPGEKGLFWFVKLAVLIGAIYLTWVYVLPPVFKMVGQIVAIVATVLFIVMVVMAMPVIIKWLRSFTRFLHKLFITYHPFEELDSQRGKMVQNRENYRGAKGKLIQIKNEAEINAADAEKKAKAYETKILSLDKEAKSTKKEMEAMEQKDGLAARATDEFVELNSSLLKTLSESGRITNMMAQEQDFVTKYGSRANVMKKIIQKMTMYETVMDIKIADFDATVEILKKDYAFAQNSRKATEAAKSAMMFTTPWEVEFALEVVTNTIASDNAITAGNLKDIDTLTTQYPVDSDELYANLDNLANKIRTGENVIPSAKKFSNPEYKLTAEEKQKSGGFGDIF